jgi:hypothetical protein
VDSAASVDGVVSAYFGHVCERSSSVEGRSFLDKLSVYSLLNRLWYIIH